MNPITIGLGNYIATMGVSTTHAQGIPDIVTDEGLIDIKTIPEMNVPVIMYPKSRYHRYENMIEKVGTINYSPTNRKTIHQNSAKAIPVKKQKRKNKISKYSRKNNKK